MDTNKHIKEIFFPNSNSIATTYYLEHVAISILNDLGLSYIVEF